VNVIDNVENNIHRGCVVLCFVRLYVPATEKVLNKYMTKF
jgi:hypothetical protein